MTRSMQPTIAKLESMAQDTPPATRRSDYALGYSHGSQAAYRRMGYVMTAAAVCGLILWML